SAHGDFYRRLSTRTGKTKSITLLFLISIRRPTTSTLFPYTTLFRSKKFPKRCTSTSCSLVAAISRACAWNGARRSYPGATSSWRSEEHTSELQSRSDLVCRLLLEKKNRCRDTQPAVSEGQFLTAAYR